MSASIDPTLEILQQGSISIEGEFLWGSNYTYLVQAEMEGEKVQAVYKPSRGERPLWDFPAASLAKREVAAYIVSEAMGWNFIPPTAYRKTAPFGPGSLQMFIDHNPDYHYFNFVEKDRNRLKPVVAFDLLVNNADRKGSHIIRDPDNKLWLIDHGLCFHVEDKLRTVIWDFAEDQIPEQVISDIHMFSKRLHPKNDSVSELEKDMLVYLSQAEVAALASRAKKLIDVGYFSAPDMMHRPFPWPQI